jgi:hypothetical protein
MAPIQYLAVVHEHQPGGALDSSELPRLGPDEKFNAGVPKHIGTGLDVRAPKSA